ncbi:type 1 fimbrial protein [Cronobacter malonaticus]|uniref:fimbrial protein n=1 Tax=Cronobacter malonaticus TaxID=413503 RepID=UPI000CFE2421|nr:spore coat protein U domain-containing protein [Cronobacter malonaticus]NCH03623.1 type 1 fimbrial protein [Cronobacter malonaticus]NCH52996.1 type 1 fimbrial protein [Cronobacter malonaticus]
MKKLTLAAALAASAFAMGANAATTSASFNITGKVVPSACTISTGADNGTIDFGTISAYNLSGTPFFNKSASLSVACDTETTALIKVSGSKGVLEEAQRFQTDQEFATYQVLVKNLHVTDGTATNSVLITANPDDEVDMNHLSDSSFKKYAAASFPLNGKYFGAATSNSGVGTFKNLTADLSVAAYIDAEKAKAAVKDGEKTFAGTLNFELNYL